MYLILILICLCLVDVDLLFLFIVRKVMVILEVFIVLYILDDGCLLLVVFFCIIDRFGLEWRCIFLYIVVDVVEDGCIFFWDGGWIGEGKCLLIYFFVYKILIYFFLVVLIYFKFLKFFVSLYWWINILWMVLWVVLLLIIRLYISFFGFI